MNPKGILSSFLVGNPQNAASKLPLANIFHQHIVVFSRHVLSLWDESASSSWGRYNHCPPELVVRCRGRACLCSGQPWGHHQPQTTKFSASGFGGYVRSINTNHKASWAACSSNSSERFSPSPTDNIQTYTFFCCYFLWGLFISHLYFHWRHSWVLTQLYGGTSY